MEKIKTYLLWIMVITAVTLFVGTAFASFIYWIIKLGG